MSGSYWLTHLVAVQVRVGAGLAFTAELEVILEVVLGVALTN